jgi:hypothetical protein
MVKRMPRYMNIYKYKSVFIVKCIMKSVVHIADGGNV